MKWTFDSNQERQSYPIDFFVSLVPERMWHDTALFNQTLSDVTLQLMSTEISELETLAAEEYLQEDMTAQEMQCIFLAIALSHPHASDEALLRIAETMRLPGQYLYTCAARLGRIGLMEPALSNAAREVSTQLHPSESALSNLQKIMTLAVTYGHIKVVDYLADLAPNCLEPIIRMNHYEVFKASAWSGQLPVMQRLMQLAQPNIKHLIRQGAYSEAIMETLLTVYRFMLNQVMIKALNWFYPNWLKPILHENVKTMLHDDNDRALIQVAEAGHLEVLQGLFEQYTPRYSGIAYAFMNAAAKGHEDIAHWLLSNPYGFNIADCQDSVYGVEYVHPFITEKLDELKYRQQHAVLSNEPFKLKNHDEKLLCIYMARNLIRRNDVAFLDDIRFLLTIPSVNAIAHTHSTYEPNHLLRLAMTVENQEAIDFLLTIPAIAQLAQQHDYYRAERRNGLDADVMAHDRESSLRALSPGERQRLARATAHYAPRMSELGSPAIISQLKQLLASRYHSNPATLVRDDHRMITLPIDWHQFQALALTAGEQQRALVAYYQNKNHTALRFLSKPNPWIHAQAPFVMTSEQGQWASFEAYQYLICLFFLAACDERYAPRDSAIEHFVDELAHINRAHNWDNTRQNGDNTEEYDDLTGDKPSCFSGMKRRLFQSVPGHPLLMALTRDMINLELGDFIRGHCQAMLNGAQGEVFRKAWRGYVAEPNPDDLATLKALDVSAGQHQAFLAALILKYGEQFSDEPQFVNQVNQALALPPEKEAHVINCSGLARIESLFEDKPPSTSSHIEIYSVKKLIPSELNGNLSARCMTQDDLNLVMDWCMEEGWNIGRYDFSIYYKLTSKGHLIFLYENEPIGAISIIQHSDNFFTIGPFIVKNGYRGKGYGSQIWQQAMALIEQENYTASLYSVPAQVDSYQKKGFQTKFKNKRWELFHENKSLIKEKIAPCEDFSSDNLLSVSQYDQSIFSISRQKIFEELLKISAVKGFVLKNEGLITGFGLIRPCIKGWRVGPLFANTPESAKIIFTKLLSVVSDEKIIIDVPSSNKFAQVFAEYFNLTAVSAEDTEAMFKGNEPNQLLEHINENYGVFSLEIG